MSSTKKREYVEVTYSTGSPGVEKVAPLQSCIAEVLLEQGPLPVCHIAGETGSVDKEVRDALHRMRKRGLVFYSTAKVRGRGRSPRLWVAAREDLEPFIQNKPTRVVARGMPEGET